MRTVLALLATLALIVGGCRLEGLRKPQPVGPQVRVGAGEAFGGPWTAWIYRVDDGSLCLEFRSDTGPTDGGCGSAFGPFVTRGVAVTRVIGGTNDPRAKVAHLVIADQPPVDLDITTPAAGVTEDVGFYVTALPGAPTVKRIEIVDAAGGLLETTIVEER